MGVYIKGTNKKHILTIFQANGLSPKLMGIELVEVPEPHGRLIDAEYLKEHLYQCDINGMPLHIMELDERLACISDVPTIIEAEDEPQTERRCGNCKFLTYRFNKTWCDIKCENPHDVVCDKWKRSEE